MELKNHHLQNYKKTYFYIFLIIILFSLKTFTLNAANFVDAGITLTGIANGDLQWGDYDNDGDLDLLVTGSGTSTAIAAIYRNDGSNTFTNINATLTALGYSAAAWGDYDNDSDLDIIITGTTNSSYSGAKSILYKNMGNDTFTPQNITFKNAYQGSVNWADFDNDGDLDLLLAGKTGFLTSECVTKLYRNTLPDSIGFIDMTIGFQNLYNTSASWGDYDNDNDLDILITGTIDYYSTSTKIYRNDYNGSGKFTDINASVVNVSYGSAKWGDYDNDGDLDILISGNSSSSIYTKIYRNDSKGIFSDINISLKKVYYGSHSWGDYDNDGDLDIALTGTTDGSSVGRKSKIYQNNGNSTFTDIQANIDSVYNSSISWGDYDNDGDIDLIIAGNNGSTNITKIFKNGATIQNMVPSKPTNFAATFNQNQVDFNWSGATDTETSTNGLSYNLYIKKIGSTSFSLSPQADTNSGYQRTTQFGMVKNNVATYKNLKKGTYTCGVQAIDAGLKGSSFARSTFTILNNTPTAPNLIYPANQQPFSTDSVCLKWKSLDYDGDAITYTLKMGTDGNLVTHTQGIVKDSIWIKNLVAGKNYQWQILATDATNSTSTSVIQTFSTSFAEKEPNNTFGLANLSTNAVGFYGSVGNNNDENDYFCLTYPYNGILKVTVANLNNIALTNGGLNNVTIYNNSQSTITTLSNYNLNAGQTNTSINIKINANQNYYVQISPENIGDFVPYHLTFTIDTSLVKDFFEPNNSYETSYPLYTDSISATIGFGNDMDDWYKIGFNGIGTFQIKVTNPVAFPDISDGLSSINIYNSAKELITSIYDNTIDNGETSTSQLTGVTAGQYYFIKVGAANSFSSADYTIKIISTVQIKRNYSMPTVPIPINIDNSETSILPGDTTLFWLCSHPNNLPITYNFYYGKTSPPPIKAKGLTKNEFKITNINWDDTIYWKVTAFSEATDSVISPIYNFSSRYITESSISFTGASNGNSNWGDYDNDGDLDLLLTGSTNGSYTGSFTKIYRNNGSEPLGFSEINASLPALYSGNAVWGDYDNDNDLDILITGTTDGYAAGAKTNIYRNNGNNSFTDINAGLPSLFYSNAVWGDYNNDGLLDIALIGTQDGNATGKLSLIYKNNGNGSFTNINAELTGVYSGQINWVDYNNDGFLDLFLTGKTGTNSTDFFTAIFQNNKNGTFANTNANLSQIKDGSAAWGDYDNDGDLDLLLAGSTSIWSSSNIAKIYQNNLPTSLGFTQITTGLSPLNYCSVAWGDYNNDGYIDIISSGKNNSGNAETKIYKNNKNNTFTSINAGLANLYNSTVSWVDFDKDNDLDLFIMGEQQYTYKSVFYKNNISIKNIAPKAPDSLFSVITKQGLLMGWIADTDNETNAFGLSYNLALYDANHKLLSAPMADTTSGTRKLATFGNIKTNGILFDLNLLSTGKYYWKVQSIDASFAGSTWSEQMSFVYSSGVNPSITLISPASDSIGIDVSGSILKWSSSHPNNQSMSYNVYFGTDSHNPPLVSSNQNITSYTLSNLDYNKTYYWRVEAKDTDGNVVSTLIHKFTTCINKAPIVSLIAPEQSVTLNSTKVKFIWKASDPEKETLKYTLQFYTTSLDTVTIANLIDTVLQIDTLRYNKNYYWRIKAYDTFGNKTQTNYSSFYTGSNSAPTISLISPKDYSLFNSPTFNLVWSASDINNDALSYNIKITSNLDATVEVFNYTDTVFPIKTDTLIYGAVYYWIVTAIDSYGNKQSTWSWQFQIENSAPTITLLSPAIDSTNTPLYIDLIWTALDYENEDITYNVNFSPYYYPDLYKSNLTDTFLRVGRLSTGTRYYWEVIATDTSGNSKTSSKFYFNTLNNSEPQVTLVSPQNWSNNLPFNITLLWSATDPDNDTLTYSCYCYDSGTNDTLFFDTTKDTSVNLFGLKTSTDYYWQITATDKYGNVDVSDTWRFSTAEEPIGWFNFHVTDNDNNPLKNALIRVNSNENDYQNYYTENTGYVNSNTYPMAKYNIFASKPGFFSSSKTNVSVPEFDTSKVAFKLTKIGDFNNDNKMNQSDLDSLVANWRSKNTNFEMGPATGAAPNFDVAPDGIFDFEDVMIFSLLWDYYNTNENLVQKSVDGIGTQTAGSGSLSSITETQPENTNTVKFNLFLSNLNNISSVGLHVKYDAGNMEFVSAKNQLLNPNQNILFTQHNDKMGLLKISSAMLQANNVESQTDFLSLTFNKFTNEAQIPEVFYEIHFTDKTIASGLLQLQQTQTEISIYPNPTNQYLYIKTPAGQVSATITITDVLGKIIYKTTSSTNELKVDVSQFNQKIVFVNVKLGSQVITKKIIVAQENRR